MALKAFQELRANILTRDAPIALIASVIPRVLGAWARNCGQRSKYIFIINHNIIKSIYVCLSTYPSPILLDLFLWRTPTGSEHPSPAHGAKVIMLFISLGSRTRGAPAGRQRLGQLQGARRTEMGADRGALGDACHFSPTSQGLCKRSYRRRWSHLIPAQWVL